MDTRFRPGADTTVADEAGHPLDDPIRESLRGVHAHFARWSGRIAAYHPEVAPHVGHPAANTTAIRLYERLGFTLRTRSVLTHVRTPVTGKADT